MKPRRAFWAPWGASADERTGWQLHQLGYDRPPLRVLAEPLLRSVR
jgi:hypothetical protein